jgi:hypothetical protein
MRCLEQGNFPQSTAFSDPGKLLSNYCIISNHGFVIIRFHWHNRLWEDPVENDIMLASSLLTQCIWDNC